MAKFNPLDAFGGVVSGMNPAGAIVGAIVGQVLKRSDVPMDNASVPATMNKVAQAVADAVVDDKIAIVPVKSGWASKISWMQVAGPAASTIAIFLSFFGLKLTPDQIIGVVMAIQTIQSIVTWIIRQWFTSSVTAASMVPPLTRE